MSEEFLIVVCPNPKCQREIEEPILLTILSVTPPKEYYACPYCFSKLEPKPLIKEEDVSEPKVDEEEDAKKEDESDLSVNSVLEKVKDSDPRFLQRFKALIPDSEGPQKQKREKLEEIQTEPVVEKENETKTKSAAKKDGELSSCPESFGYLANRPTDTPIPSECLVCPKMVDCMLSPRESKTS